MKEEKLIPSLIFEDEEALPRRGGNYVSMATKKDKEIKKAKSEIERLEKELSCNCNCDCDCNSCNC